MSDLSKMGKALNSEVRTVERLAFGTNTHLLLF